MSEPIPPYPSGGQPPPYPPPPPYYYQRPPERRSRWWIPVVIIGGVLGLFIVGIVVVFMVIGSAVGSSFENEPVKVKTQSVLYLKASGMLEEIERTSGFSLFSSSPVPVNLMNTLTAIRRAKDDGNIVGVYFEGGLNAGFAKSAELRDALVDFKKSGKFIYAFLETGDESSYYLASVADSIFMPTEGLLEMNGYAVVAPFFKDALNKIGIDFYVQQFEEYKSAGESFSRTGFSEPARRELESILAQRYTVLTESIAQSRGLNVEMIRSAMNRGVYTADTLLALDFIDGIKSHMEAKEWIREKVNVHSKKDSVEKLRLVSLKEYINSSTFASSDKVDEDKQIAIVFGSGNIVSGKTANSAFGSENQIASESFIGELRKARDNEKVKAIILRIDSPGGSVIASDAIWSEIREARKVKPVYASMSDVAASGGYYMAMACDTIIAHPQTITGSIGVILMIPNLTGALDKLGISVDTIKTSESAAFLNPMLPFSATEKAKLYSLSEKIYHRFVARVAESRGKTFEQTREVAKGRVWTGKEAKDVGLVDVLGGLQESINIAKKRIGVSPDTKVAIRIYPEPRNPVDVFFSMFDDDDEDASLSSSVQKTLQPGIEQMPMWNLVPAPMKSQVRYMLQLNEMAMQERTLMALPNLIEAR